MRVTFKDLGIEVPGQLHDRRRHVQACIATEGQARRQRHRFRHDQPARDVPHAAIPAGRAVEARVVRRSMSSRLRRRLHQHRRAVQRRLRPTVDLRCGSRRCRGAVDFASQCQRACSAGTDSCKVQDSRNSCYTFVYHCIDTCPWTVTDTYNDFSVEHSNAFEQCSSACVTGYPDRQKISVKLAARKRTGTFDACQEAQGACYRATCDRIFRCRGAGDRVTDFPDTCAEACFNGVAPCRSTAAQKCEEFTQKCAATCPQVVTDSDGDEVENANGASRCELACKEGQAFCASLLQ